MSSPGERSGSRSPRRGEAPALGHDGLAVSGQAEAAVRAAGLQSTPPGERYLGGSWGSFSHEEDDEQDENLWGELCSWYGWDCNFWVSGEEGSFATRDETTGSVPPSRRGAEVSLKSLSRAERELFIFSDAKEWQPFLDIGAAITVCLKRPKGYLQTRSSNSQPDW